MGLCGFEDIQRHDPTDPGHIGWGCNGRFSIIKWKIMGANLWSIDDNSFGLSLEFDLLVHSLEWTVRPLSWIKMPVICPSLGCRIYDWRRWHFLEQSISFGWGLIPLLGSKHGLRQLHSFSSRKTTSLLIIDTMGPHWSVEWSSNDPSFTMTLTNNQFSPWCKQLKDLAIQQPHCTCSTYSTENSFHLEGKLHSLNSKQPCLKQPHMD